MKKAIRWIVSAILFLMLTLVILGQVSEVMRKKVGAESDMIHSFYDLEEDSLDVLCIGSSHGYSAVQPNVLWGEYGITSYVMCSPRQTVASSYYLLKEALEYQKPQVVLLETFYFLYGDGKYESEGKLRQAFDGMRLGKAKIEMVEDFLGDLSWKDKMSYYFPFLMYHSRWSELNDTDFNSDLFLKGSILDYDIYEQEDPGVPDQVTEIPQVVTEYLEKIISLCEENEIELVLYAAPYGYSKKGKYKTYARKQGINNAVEIYAQENEIPFIFYQKGNLAGLDFATDFRDASHMNTYGSSKISRHLGEYLTENYGFEDHRQDEAYQSWNEDYEKYCQESDRLLEKAKD